MHRQGVIRAEWSNQVSQLLEEKPEADLGVGETQFGREK